MQLLAAFGDAPTAVIAVLAIVLGVFLAARGPREQRAGANPGGGDASGPAVSKVPAAGETPDAEAVVAPGFAGPRGAAVGHGRSGLGTAGPAGGEPAPAHAAAAPVEPAPAPEPERQALPEPPAPAHVAAAPVEPAPAPEPERPAAHEPPAPGAPASEPARPEAAPAASDQALFTSPPTLPEPPAASPDDAAADRAATPETAPAADADADAAREPAWRIAARAARSKQFRQGAIRLDGTPTETGEPKDRD